MNETDLGRGCGLFERLGRDVDRRRVSALLAAGMVLGSGRSSGLCEDTDGQELFRDVVSYDGLGEHRTASAADNSCSSWLEARLQSCGFTVELQPFTTAQFEPRTCSLKTESGSISAFPAWPVSPTKEEGITGFLSSGAVKPLGGNIAVVKLPFGRSGAWTDARIKSVTDAIHARAIAVVVITEGPTCDLIALNAPIDRLVWPVPVVLVGCHDEQGIEDGQLATLTSTGNRISTARATNVIARRPGVGATIVVTTPKSGWFRCAGERGSGLAIFLSLAAWLPRQTKRPLLFAATSGHELGEIGARAFLRESVPRPADTAVWLHIGANVAVQNIATMGPITGDGTAVVARSLFVSPNLETVASQAFAGVPGFDKPKVIGTAPLPGELREFHDAGYANLVGLVGSGPLFHTRFDRAAIATTPAILAPVASGSQRLLKACS